MQLNYPEIMKSGDRYRFCPMCAAELGPTDDTEGIFRAKCTRCDWTYFPRNLIGVNILIETDRGLVFLFPPEEPEGRPAALPGGIVEFGETPEEATIREAREETGLVVNVVKELGRYFARDFIWGPMLNFILLTEAIGGELRAGHEGEVEARAIENIPKISRNRPGSQRALLKYLEYKNTC